MQPTHSLERLERQVYRAVVDDGVWDVLLGLAILSIGFGVGPFVIASVVAGGRVLTRRTRRRTGYVQFLPARTTRLRRAAWLLPGVAMVVLAALIAAGPRLHDLVKAGLMLATPVAAAGYLFDIPRLYTYAALILASVASVLALGAAWEWTLVGSGGAIAATGLIVLVRFIQRHPLETEQQDA